MYDSPIAANNRCDLFHPTNLSGDSEMTSRRKASAPAAASLLSLAALVAAGETGLFAPEASGKPLVDAGHAEMHPELKDAEGNRAFRATAAGVEAAKAAEGQPSGDTGSGQPSGAAPADKPKFAIASDVPMPETVRPASGGRTEQYPFSALEKGQSFFVPGKTPKSLASTVSGARQRYSEEIAGQTRKNRKGADVPATKQLRDFIVKEVPDGKAWGAEYAGVKGSAVWRTL
jgi:hypothetical protein